jgi:hypothetical protein
VGFRVFRRFYPASLFQATEQVAQRATPLWPWLALAALCLLVVDVALKRVGLGLMVGRGRRT